LSISRVIILGLEEEESMARGWWRIYPRAYRSVCVLAGALLLAVSLFTTGGIVRAAAFGVTVTTTADKNDACATTGTGECSLRDAIRYANARTSADTTTITLPAGTYYLTQTGTTCEDAALTGDLDISQNVILNGANPATTIIDGMGNDRVLSINNGTRTVSVANVTIQNGRANPGCGSNAGGIAMVGHVTLTNVVVTNNVARFAGGINAVGSLTLINSTVRNNIACGPGGIASSNGILTLTNTTISGNTATGASSALTSVGGCPGGVRGYAGGIDTSSVTHLTNSTISGNSNTWGAADDAGGIRASGTTTIAYSTIANNTISGGAGSAGGVLNRVAGSTLTIQGDILSGNTGGNCVNGGTLTSQGYNLADDALCNLIQPTDHPGVDPNLAPLAYNGGPTQTRALLAGSPARDAGGTSATGCPATDQRGVSRPMGLACDIGAYELRVDPTPSIQPPGSASVGAPTLLPTPSQPVAQPAPNGPPAPLPPMRRP
jgi:CSLREA domain-containing protein